ncbi:MAG: SIMPL domain-containing protein [Patescibacteria group bacterium]
MKIKKLALNLKGDTSTFILRIVGVVLLAAVLIIAIVRDRIVNPPQWQVSVVGQGKVTFVPDIAKINLGVRVDKVDSAEEALKQINTSMGKVITAVTALGIDKNDINTQNYALYPQYNNVDNISSVIGYGANEDLLVTVRGIDKNNDLVGKVISEASKAGANQVNGVSFEASNLEGLKQQARILAISDARSKAKQLSRVMGVRLGKIVSWWENYPTPYYDAKGGLGVGGGTLPSSIPTGSGEISMEMNISYQIK